MKTKVVSLMLMAILSVSIMACGDASGGSVNSTASEMKYGPIEGVPAGAEFVESKAEESSDVEVDSTDSVEDVTSELSIAEDEGYTGELYTLPVAKKGEEWSEAQLDEYLASSKVFKNALDDNVFDFDYYMESLGFKYLGAFGGSGDGDKGVSAHYYYERKNYRILVVMFYDNPKINIIIDNGKETVIVREYYSGTSGTVPLCSKAFSKGVTKYLFKLENIKGFAASMDYLVNSKQIDCARLPYPMDYDLSYGGAGSILNENLNPREDKIEIAERANPYLY